MFPPLPGDPPCICTEKLKHHNSTCTDEDKIFSSLSFYKILPWRAQKPCSALSFLNTTPKTKPLVAAYASKTMKICLQMNMMETTCRCGDRLWCELFSALPRRTWRLRQNVLPLQQRISHSCDSIQVRLWKSALRWMWWTVFTYSWEVACEELLLKYITKWQWQVRTQKKRLRSIKYQQKKKKKSTVKQMWSSKCLQMINYKWPIWHLQY